MWHKRRCIIYACGTFSKRKALNASILLSIEGHYALIESRNCSIFSLTNSIVFGLEWVNLVRLPRCLLFKLYNPLLLGLAEHWRWEVNVLESTVVRLFFIVYWRSFCLLQERRGTITHRLRKWSMSLLIWLNNEVFFISLTLLGYNVIIGRLKVGWIRVHGDAVCGLLSSHGSCSCCWTTECALGLHSRFDKVLLTLDNLSSWWLLTTDVLLTSVPIDVLAFGSLLLCFTLDHWFIKSFLRWRFSLGLLNINRQHACNIIDSRLLYNSLRRSIKSALFSVLVVWLLFKCRRMVPLRIISFLRVWSCWRQRLQHMTTNLVRMPSLCHLLNSFDIHFVLISNVRLSIRRKYHVLARIISSDAWHLSFVGHDFLYLISWCRRKITAKVLLSLFE